MIKKNSIPVIFADQTIYIDDTIETIKKKIIIEQDKQISFDEIYLFAKQIQQFDNTHIYDNLTHNGKMILSRDILFQYLSNITDFDINQVPIKDTYTYNDIIDLNLTNSPHLTTISLGQHIITSNDEII